MVRNESVNPGKMPLLVFTADNHNILYEKLYKQEVSGALAGLTIAPFSIKAQFLENEVPGFLQ